jgi:periplasmic divalent cation tolerance protein
MTDYIIALCTCPNEDTGTKIAEALVDGKIAACVNIVPGLKSVYRWQGKICRDAEVLLIIKTEAGKYTELESAVRKLHPYEVPEIVAIPIVQGYEKYLEWIGENIKGE